LGYLDEGSYYQEGREESCKEGADGLCAREYGEAARTCLGSSGGKGVGGEEGKDEEEVGVDVENPDDGVAGNRHEGKGEERGNGSYYGEGAFGVVGW